MIENSITPPDSTLLMKYIRGLSSEEENTRITSWLENDPENEKILLQIAHIYYAELKKERIKKRDVYAAYDKIQHRKKRKKQQFTLRRLTVAAACILAIFSISYNIFQLTGKNIVDEVESRYITVQTNAGMRTTLNLPDGTIVSLNSATKLTYPVPFDKKERRITLEGEGYFVVKRDENHPFVVHVEDKKLDVEVLGTEFNVMAYPSDDMLRTTLVEGSVKLLMETKNGGTQSVILKPSERASYNPIAGSLSINKVNTLYDTVWKEGRLMFKDTPLSEVLNRLSHFYNVSFEIQDEVINSYRFTGTFENRQLTQVLDYLHISSRINYRLEQPTEDDSNGIKRTKVYLFRRR